MKNVEKKKYKIVYDKSASGFEKKLNKAIDALEDFHPDITIDSNRQDGFLAYIIYTEDYKIPETLNDELEIRGISITCSDCPYMQRSNDHRKKWFKCKYASYERTSIDSPACNKFYEDLIRYFIQYSMENKHDPDKEISSNTKLIEQQK